MRAFIKNYIAAEKARRGKAEDEGFSLIELIVVVVILGILVAIAIPIFFGLQQTAQDNSREAAAANAATQVAAELASAGSATIPTATSEFTFSWGPAGAPTTVDGVCVVATDGAGATSDAGPGC